MKTCILDCARMTERAAAHAYIARALDFPDYYGRNLDALYDCLTDGKRTVVLRNTAALRDNPYGRRLLDTFRDAAREHPALLTLTVEEPAAPRPAYADPADARLASMLPYLPQTQGIDFAALDFSPAVTHADVEIPEEGYRFLHEAAVTAFRGVLYAAWYNNPARELSGYTPIRARWSEDGGRSWSPIFTVADDPSERILYCPPVFGEDEGKLYLLLNEMVGPDRIHALDLYVLDEATRTFRFLWSRPIPFKLNTNVLRLSNGKLLLPGRIAELDGFPNTPAVLISDSGHIDAEWRLVCIRDDGNLPDGAKLVHPELTAIAEGAHIRMFCRDDERRVPLLYTSDDWGETWAGPWAHEIPFSSSKLYAGTLSTGQHYIIGNRQPDRKALMLLYTRPGESRFSGGLLLRHEPDAASHYPAACEMDGKLCVIYSANAPGENSVRGAGLEIVPLEALTD